jgi:hypothetical protein
MLPLPVTMDAVKLLLLHDAVIGYVELVINKLGAYEELNAYEELAITPLTFPADTKEAVWELEAHDAVPMTEPVKLPVKDADIPDTFICDGSREFDKVPVVIPVASI